MNGKNLSPTFVFVHRVSILLSPFSCIVTIVGVKSSSSLKSIPAVARSNVDRPPVGYLIENTRRIFPRAQSRELSVVLRPESHEEFCSEISKVVASERGMTVEFL
jgi:hypothetical protein